MTWHRPCVPWRFKKGRHRGWRGSRGSFQEGEQVQNPPPRARTETWAMCAGVIASGRAWGWGGLAATRVDGRAGLLTAIGMITDSLTFFSECVTEQIPLFFFFFFNINRKKLHLIYHSSFLPILMCPYLLIKPSWSMTHRFYLLVLHFLCKRR